MEMQFILLETENNTCAVMQVVRRAEKNSFSPKGAQAVGFTLDEETDTWYRDLTKKLIEAEIAKLPGIVVLSWRLIEASAVPVDRTFRDAWKIENKKIAVDMNKARDLHRQKLRDMREPKLKILDGAYQIADEEGNTAEKEKIAAKKQALRDVTADPAIDAATTPDKLKAVIPAALKE